MKHYQMTFEIPEHKLQLIISLLTGEIGALKITELARTTPGMRERKSVKRGSPMTEAVEKYLAALKSGTQVSRADLERVLISGGFKATNASPMSTLLVRAGKLVGLKKGLFRVP